MFRLEARQTNKIADAVDGFLDRRRHGGKIGPMVRMILAFLNRTLPRSNPKWAVESGRVPIIREQSPGTLMLHHRRNIALFEWFLTERNEAFLYRVNSSSFVEVSRLENFLSSVHHPEPLIGGRMTVDGFGRHFLSGASLLMNRKAVELLYEARFELRRDLPEDVSISILAKSLAIPAIEIPSIEVADDFSFDEDNLVKAGVFHFRCKSPVRPEGDVQKMLKISAFFSSQTG